MNVKAIAIIAGVACVTSANAVSLAVWNFNDSPSGGLADLVVDREQAGLSSLLTTNFEAANVTHFTGTTVNADAGDPAGRALALQGGPNTINNGRWIQFSFNTTGWQDLELSYATQRTSTGFNSQTLEYSVDGGSSYNLVGTHDTIPSSFAAHAWDLTAITALENASNVLLRITVTGATTESGNNRLDNVVLSGETVPEPATLAVLGIGLVAALRRRSRK